MNCDVRFSELQSLEEEHGHCSVLQNTPRLGRWVSNQRCLSNDGTLKADRHDRLDNIGFRFSPHDAVWDAQFSELQSFKEEHGYCNVPQSAYPQLGSGVTNQQSNSLEPE